MKPTEFLKLARLLPEASLLIAGTGEILEINRPVTKLLHSGRREIVGQQLRDLAIDAPDKITQYLKMCSQSRQMLLGTLTFAYGDNNTIQCKTKGAVIQPRSAEGPAILLVQLEKHDKKQFVVLNQKIHALSKEIQQRKRTQVELGKANVKLNNTLHKLQSALDAIQQEKMSSLGQLVAGIAHEINNPISFIYGNIQHAYQYCDDLLNLIHLYQEHYPVPHAVIQDKACELDLDFVAHDSRKLFSSMQTGADRIRDIVLALRNFSRLDESEVKKVNIHQGLDASLMLIQNRLKAQEKQHQIQILKNYSELPLIECFPGPLNQVFINLLNNAIDALENIERDQSPEMFKQIAIATEQLEQDRIAIRIKDNGTGIPVNIQSQIFEPFFTTKPLGKGTGLGLSISYQVITSHGGEIYVDSAPDWGTQFTVELPVTSHIS